MLWVIIGGVIAVLDVAVVGLLIGAAFAQRPVKLADRSFYCHDCNRSWIYAVQLDWHRYACHRELPFDEGDVRVLPPEAPVDAAPVTAVASTDVVTVRSGNVVYLIPRGRT